MCIRDRVNGQMGRHDCGASNDPVRGPKELPTVERTRVIIADDESLIRMDLREMLTNLGYLVVGEVGDGRSAVNLARELRPDIVIMDIKMPDMDGIEAAKVLSLIHISEPTRPY